MSPDRNERELSMERVLGDVGVISEAVVRALTPDNRARLLGSELAPFFQTETSRRVPTKAVIMLALFSDCLRVVDMALRADGEGAIDEQSVAFVEPLVYPATRFYKDLRARYQPFVRLEHGSLDEFLATLRDDDQPFGHACPATHWIGLELCHRVALETGDTEVRDIYESMIIWLMDEIIALDGVSAAEAKERARLERFIELRKKMQENDAVTSDVIDPRIRGFCNRYAPRVFTPTQHANQLWEYDPYDVEWVHEEARTVFDRLVEQVAGPIPSDHGRILLVLGESGSGKTHLMRAYRTQVHTSERGYVGYMQISTHATDYADFVLCKFIDSLEKPYDPRAPGASGLVRLSNALAEQPSRVAAQALVELRENAFDDDAALHAHVYALADDIIASSGYHELDLNVVRALLYLQRNDPRIRSRVLAYLRCEPMSEYDRRVLGDIAPRAHGREAPLRTLEQLGRIMWATENAAMVLLLDQIEDIVQLDESENRLHDVFAVVRHLIDQIPTAVVVISCLDDLYVSVKSHIMASTLDRIERDPAPVRLTSRRRTEEIEAICARRLEHLYDTLDIRQYEDDSLFPLRADTLGEFANYRTRDVLDWCHNYHEACIARGQLVDLAAVAGPIAAPPPDASRAQAEIAAMEQAWVDFTSDHGKPPPDDDAAMLELLSWAMRACAAEQEPGYRLESAADEDGYLSVTAPAENGALERLLVGMCNRGAQRDALIRQIDEVERRAGEQRARPVIVRSSEFTKSSKSKTGKRVGELLRQGGRRVSVEDTEWRDMAALREFLATHEQQPGVAEWRRETRPLSQLNAMRDLLALHTRRPVSVPANPEPEPPKPEPEPPGPPATSGTAGTAAAPAATESGSVPASASAPAPASAASLPSALRRDAARPPGPLLHLGQTVSSLAREDLDLRMGALTRHAAFLGSSGSGKTTLALHIVEQLLRARIPVVLIDRKGDLAGYAAPAEDTGNDARRALLAEVDVALYTPGEPRGRPLALPVVPAGLAELSSHERTKIARYAAAALGAMMKYKESSSERARTAILGKAIELLSESQSDQPVTLSRLIDVIGEQDPALVEAIGRLDTKHFAKLVDDLVILQMNHGELLAAAGEALEPERLLRCDPASGRARLSIISTKFLGDTASIQFWVAQLLIALGRYASKHPSSRLQAALLFDEADVYLPAQTKPPTKEPMQDLLKRARSAGIGVMLATQSPGDLEYRSRDNIATWFVGKISEQRAIGKMKPLLSECQKSIDKKLPTYGVGEFAMLQGGNVSQFRAARSLLDTVQLAEDTIRRLARATMPGQTSD